MQLANKVLLTLFLLSPFLSFSQTGKLEKKKQKERSAEDDAIWFKKNAFTNTEINILAGYYQQEGDHSAVLGGTGTEELTDFTPTIIVNVPIDSSRQLSINLGVDFYSSASTDNIDDISSASGKDSREHLDLTFTKRIPYRRKTFNVSAGYSTEYDVESVNVGASWTKESYNGNREFTIGGKAYFDTWSIYSPQEFVVPNISGEGEESDTRQSYTLSFNYSQVISKRLQASISLEGVYQTGLLSTPFHRVFINDGVDVTGLTERELINSPKLRTVERLPDSRLKLPIGLTVNYYASDLFVFRLKYRFYTDDFGLTGNTFNVDVPVKINPFLSVIPFYRYHTQTAADYFKNLDSIPAMMTTILLITICLILAVIK
jgi:hypothetical protein